jgi:uncharacterized membrane protein YccC
MPSNRNRARPRWLLVAIGVIFLVIGVTNLATFPGGGPVSKWLQLGLGVLGLVLGVVWLTWVATVVRAQSAGKAIERHLRSLAGDGGSLGTYTRVYPAIHHHGSPAH